MKEAQPVTFKHYSRKGYSIFNSLSREVRIGVLTVVTLATATLQKVEAMVPDTTPEAVVDDEDGKSNKIACVSSQICEHKQHKKRHHDNTKYSQFIWQIHNLILRGLSCQVIIKSIIDIYIYKLPA